MPLTIVALWHMRWLQHCVLPCPVMIFWSTWTTACLEKQPVTMHSPWKFPKVLILICFQLNLIESQSMLEKWFWSPYPGWPLSFFFNFGFWYHHVSSWKNNRFPSPVLAASQTSPMRLAIAKLFHMQRWLPWTVFNLKSVAPPALSTFTPLHIFCIYIYTYL